jgi:N-terminal domain of (some) glycogen debranching enzymes
LAVSHQRDPPLVASGPRGSEFAVKKVRRHEKKQRIQAASRVIMPALRTRRQSTVRETTAWDGDKCSPFSTTAAPVYDLGDAYSLRVTLDCSAAPKDHIVSFKVHVGPPQIAIHQGQTVLVSEPDGQINWPSEKGLYFRDTRIVSNWAIYANGEPWELLNGGPVNYHAARIFLTNRTILTEDGTIPPRTLGLTVSRSISGGLHEDLDITNNSNEAGALSARDRLPMRLCRHLRGQIGPHRTPWPDHDRMVGTTATGSHFVFQS